ncbi:hypothetical protein BDU57DRAFT_554043 [Ampelomyces quisqualis]|uniref:Uncharacterized protein n=1 Tax=Ampelomyces quisqualis TaxID=50730 RepID=A0A6A5R3T2_AMPQU|nr:hypothetical protein BDU57DRAFT_554043 [Ampelomyces quisqualis]
METQNATPILRPRRTKQLLPKQLTPGKDKKLVSVAAIFNRQPELSKDFLQQAQLAPKVQKLTQKNALEELQSFQSIPSSHSPQQTAYKVSKRKSEMHPLAVEYMETSDDYRRHLYKSTTLKINTTLERLLGTLYESSLHAMSSDVADGTASPVRLTMPAKFEHEALKLYQSISAYKVGLTRTDSDGTQTQLMSTLDVRMMDYTEHVAKQKAEVEKLKRDWETTVGEIWKVGVQCLGEDAMKSMLFTQKDATELSSSPVQAESALFVPEQGTSPPPRTAHIKKRVTFEKSVADEGLSVLLKKTIDFLNQPTRLRLAPVPTMPALPKQQLDTLEAKIQELGRKEFDEYKKAKKDYKVYWQKKNERLAQVLVED